MPSQPTVECCLHNINMDTYETVESCDVDVNKQHCLHRCGICHNSPFIVVDGDVKVGESQDQIMNQLDLLPRGLE